MPSTLPSLLSPHPPPLTLPPKNHATANPTSNNSLQLPRIPDRILNDLFARHQNLLFRPHIAPLLHREIYPSVLDDPAARVCEFDDAALAVEEEEVLGVGDGEGGVGALGAGSDFGADGAD